MTETRLAGPRFPTARGSGNLARRSSRDWCPPGSAPRPGRRITAPKQGARPWQEALRCVCGCCSIRARRRPTLDQQVGSPARTARRHTHQSDIVFHAYTLRRSGYIAQQERLRTKRPASTEGVPGMPRGAVWLKDSCGPETRRPNSEDRKKAETRNPKTSHCGWLLSCASAPRSRPTFSRREAPAEPNPNRQLGGTSSASPQFGPIRSGSQGLV